MSDGSTARRLALNVCAAAVCDIPLRTACTPADATGAAPMAPMSWHPFV